MYDSYLLTRYFVTPLSKMMTLYRGLVEITPGGGVFFTNFS